MSVGGVEDEWRTSGGRVEDEWRTSGGRVEDEWRTSGYIGMFWMFFVSLLYHVMRRRIEILTSFVP